MPIYTGSKSLEVQRDFFSAPDKHSLELLLLSAGYDAYTDNPLGELNLFDANYRWITSMISDVADRHS